MPKLLLNTIVGIGAIVFIALGMFFIVSVGGDLVVQLASVACPP